MYAFLEWSTAFLLACLLCVLVGAFGTLIATLVIEFGVAVVLLPLAVIAVVTVVIRNLLRT